MCNSSLVFISYTWEGSKTAKFYVCSQLSSCPHNTMCFEFVPELGNELRLPVQEVSMWIIAPVGVHVGVHVRISRWVQQSVQFAALVLALLQSHLLRRKFSICALYCSYSQSLQFSFPPGTHHCLVGSMEWGSLPHISTHEQQWESNPRPFDLDSNALSTRPQDVQTRYCHTLLPRLAHL